MKKFSCRSVKLIASVCFSQNPETESNSQFQYGVETQFDKEEGLLYKSIKATRFQVLNCFQSHFPLLYQRNGQIRFVLLVGTVIIN